MICVSKTEHEIILKILQKHVPDCKVLAFGSRYKWTNKDYSDLDLAIKGSKKLPREIIHKLKADFEESELSYKVDIIDYHAVSNEFREVIDSGHEVIMQGIKESANRSEWKKVRLGDVCSFSYGKMPNKNQISSTGYPIFSGYRVTGYYNEYMFEKPQLIIVARGVGGTGDVKFSPPYCFLTNLSIVLLLNETQCHKKYMYYYFRLNNLRYLDSGSAQSQITINDLKNLEINLPPLAEQKAIADVLSGLDDKIELNNRINKNLEEQAQAIFTRWFVDFEFPDSDGNPYKSSGGEMQDSELGEIPKGWEIGKLDNIAIIQTGKRPEKKSENFNQESPISILGASGIMGYTTHALLNELILVIGRVGTHGVVQKIDYPCWVSDNAMYFKTAFYSYVYQLLKNIDYKTLNRGSTQPLITQTDIRNQTILLSDKIKDYEKFSLPFMKKILYNEHENQKLAELRDYLLPKLMSGEIRVKE